MRGDSTCLKGFGILLTRGWLFTLAQLAMDTRGYGAHVSKGEWQLRQTDRV